MNLTEPLEGLTSAVEAAVLRVLGRSDVGFSGRQIHALAGTGSTSSVHRALGGLAHVGLITAEARPPAIIYRVNREHVLWPVIEAGLGARTRVFDSIRSFFRENVPGAAPAEDRVTVVVFGSVARGDSTLDSDVDLLVVYPDGFDRDARADVDYRASEHVRRLTGNVAQIFSIERGELEQRLSDQDPFIANVVTDGVHVFGPQLTAKRVRAA